MEVIAAASTFAGILSLARQCVGGLEKLKSLFNNMSGAYRTVDNFLSDLNNLISTVRDVEVLLDTIAARSTGATAESNINVASLQISLEDCFRDISDWLKKAKSLRASPGQGTKSIARKFLIAVNKDSVSTIRREINCRRNEINVNLFILSLKVFRPQISRQD